MENSILNEVVKKNTPLKQWLVDYVGNRHSPENDEVTVELIVETLAEDFPELLLVIAEENWIRGYEQALNDVDYGQELLKEQQNQINE